MNKTLQKEEKNRLPAEQPDSLVRRGFITTMAAGSVLGLLPGAASAQRSKENAKAEGLIGGNLTSSAVLREAWAKYYASIEKARTAMENTPRFRNNPAHRALAYQSLAEAQAMAYSFAVAPRTDNPLIYNHSWYSYLYTLGGTSPDFYYGALHLDGRKTYRVTGRFGDLRLILMQVYSHLLGHPQSKLLGNFDFSKFNVKADGSFEAIISAKRHEGNWIPLDPGSDLNFILTRRAIADWHKDRGELKIALVEDGPGQYDEFDEAALAKRISLAADFLTFLVQKWNIEIYDLYLSSNGGRKNALHVMPGTDIASEYTGSPSTNYIWGVYEIKDDEALIVESEVPKAGYWSFQLFDVWVRPFDFVHRQTDINMNRTVIDADGKFRAVIALQDPGVANWLDACGRKEGIFLSRNYLSKAIPNKPNIRLVKLADLHKHLPAETKKVSVEQRRAALEYRREGYLKLFGES